MSGLLENFWVRVLESRGLSALMAPVLGRRATIFLIHRFSHPESGLQGHAPGAVRACLEDLRRLKVRIVSLRELIRRALAGKDVRGLVAFTMDDGFWDQGEIGAEIFIEFDVPVTCFLISGLQDGVLWPWDDRLAYVYTQSSSGRLDIDLPGRRLSQAWSGSAGARAALREAREILKKLPHDDVEPALGRIAQAAGAEIPVAPPSVHRPMGWEQARALERRGVEFGPHTVSHGIVSKMSDERARAEILGAWDRLRTELATPLDVYCWPTGRAADFGPRDVAIVKSAGFHAAVATDNDYAFFPAGGCGDALYSLRRFSLPEERTHWLQLASWVGRGKQLLRGA